MPETAVPGFPKKFQLSYWRSGKPRSEGDRGRGTSAFEMVLSPGAGHKQPPPKQNIKRPLMLEKSVQHLAVPLQDAYHIVHKLEDVWEKENDNGGSHDREN